MKVTPVKKKFGKYNVGDAFELPDKAAKLLIKVGKVEEVGSSQAYMTREMRATTDPVVNPKAPYGYKSDGTPRKIRPAMVNK